jgi:hypothetical protein
MSWSPSSRRKPTSNVAHARSMADEHNFSCVSVMSRNWALSSQRPCLIIVTSRQGLKRWTGQSPKATANERAFRRQWRHAA